MSRRSVAETIELDQNLRAARSLYTIASVLFVPGALLGLVFALSGIAVLLSALSGKPAADPGAASWDVVFGVIAVGLAYVVVSQAIEASRRIKQLADNPAASVKPMYVPELLKRL